MKESRQKLTFQVFGIIGLLYLTIFIILSILDPIQENLKNQLIGGVAGSATLENFLKEKGGVMQKEVSESKTIGNSNKINSIKNKMKAISVASIIIQLLLTYIFSSFIVRFVLSKGGGNAA